MSQNKWIDKSLLLLKSIQDDYGFIYFSDYLCKMEGNSEEDYVFVLELLDAKKTLGKVVEMIEVQTKQDYLIFKAELEKITEFNMLIPELEFRHRIKSIAKKINTIDDHDRPMIAYEVRINKYNAIRLCELCDGRAYYEKYQGNAKLNGKTRFLFNQNMSYEIALLNNIQQLLNKNTGHRKKQIDKVQSNESFEEKKTQAMENLFKEANNSNINNIEQKEKKEKKEEIVINIDRNNFIANKNPKEEEIPLKDYLLIKILKYMYGDYWQSEFSLSRLTENDFLNEFKKNNPEVFDEIFKTLLIEVRGYVKNLKN